MTAVKTWRALGSTANLTRKTCPCGWFRQIAPARSPLMFDHPIYGPVTGEEMMTLDIKTHSCVQYRLAIKRRFLGAEPEQVSG